MRQRHATNKRKARKGSYDKVTCHRTERSLTLQFPKNCAQLLVNFLADSINKYEFEDVEDRGSTPREPQDEGEPVDKDDLEPGRAQQHGVTTGSHYDNIPMFDFNDNYLLSPPPEPGPSRVPCAHQVFEVEPDRELDEDGEGEEEPEQGEDTYVWFWPDVGSEGEGDDEDDEVWIEDPRLARGEDAHQLDVERSCMACGNLNTNQKMNMIKIYLFYIYLLRLHEFRSH